MQATTTSVWSVILFPVTITSNGFYYLGSKSSNITAGKLSNTGFNLNGTILQGLMQQNTLTNPLALTINSGFSGLTPAVISSSMLTTIDTDADYSALFNITYTITGYGGGSCFNVYAYNFVTATWIPLGIGSTFNQVDININAIMINATIPYCADAYFSFTVSNSRGGYVTSTNFAVSNLYATYEPFLYQAFNITGLTNTVSSNANPLLFKTLKGHTGGVNCVYVFNAWIFTASDDYTIRQWLNTDYTLIKKFPVSGAGHTGAVNRVMYDGTYLWSSGLDSVLIKWDCFKYKQY